MRRSAKVGGEDGAGTWPWQFQWRHRQDSSKPVAEKHVRCSSASSSAASAVKLHATTTTKRDEKKARSLGIISSDEGNVILPAAEKAEALPPKRSSGGFADEDDLYDFFRGFDSCHSPHGSNIDSFFPFQKEGDFFDCRGYSFSSKETSVISSLEAFASQYTSLEVDKARLQKEVDSSSSKLEGAIKIAAEARQEVDSLKDELEGLKKRLKDEETSRLAVEARMIEKDDLLRQSSLALLKAADIPAEVLDKLPNYSPANAMSMTLGSHQLVQDLLQKGKRAMARVHSMIFPKIDQNKTLGQLIDAFAINTREVLEISALKCARQLLELFSAKKSSIGPSLSNQTQAP
ncbi:hypothetical protein QYE76_044808 [Lolium multiflorum]|uniref:Uncharacterized protein n=1 Tax=Lolium multiflorum TaxID=4521 RepID=A0AAD8TJA4_LOLMU|nr:hypothetical protein QYE76_044808 [Lolium multiflorum]